MRTKYCRAVKVLDGECASLAGASIGMGQRCDPVGCVFEGVMVLAGFSTVRLLLVPL